jgi:preprotein translocase subunit SecG
MQFLFGFLMVVYVLVCIILCLLVLIQSDKGGGISSTLGGGFSSASNLLGSQDTANILTRGTTIFAGVFMALCIIISLFVAGRAANNAQGAGSQLRQRAEQQGQQNAPSNILDGQILPLEDAKTITTDTSAPALQQDSQGVQGLVPEESTQQ